MGDTVEIRQALYVNDEVVLGSKDTETTLSSDAAVLAVRQKVVADNYGEDILWATGDGGLDTPSQAFILSDQAIYIELKTDNASPEYVLLLIPANIITAVPLKVGGDDTESIDGAVLVDATDYDDVVQIRVQRDAAEGAGDATVSLYLVE